MYVVCKVCICFTFSANYSNPFIENTRGQWATSLPEKTVQINRHI